MGLGRITRFARTPKGARRVGVMRRGTAGLTELAPSTALLEAFERRKKSFIAGGARSDEAHALAADRCDYRERFKREIRRRAAALTALRALVDESKSRDVFLMCMCPYRTIDRACHTYLLLELAAELDPSVEIIDEPCPTR